MLRLFVWYLMIIAAVLLPSAAVPQPAPQRIVAIGDLHGDFDAWRAIAAAAGIADSKGRWTGGNATLVQMGDIVDRGPDSLKIIRDLMKLQRDAPKQGGQVIVVLGNHEAMMMTDDMRYVHPGEYEAFANGDSKSLRDRVYEANKASVEAAYRKKIPDMTADAIKAEWMKTMPLGKVEYIIAWRPNGELGKWALANPAVVKLGGSLFVHGGISSAYAAQSIEEINRRVVAALKARDASPTSIINHPHGPLWYRGLVVRDDGEPATAAPIPHGAAFAPTILQEIDLILLNYGVKRIVVGHTPTRGGIVEDAGGKLWRTDSAISRAYGGTLAYLEIVGDRVTAHKVPRPASKPWSTQ
jgi:hypothetical protein